MQEKVLHDKFGRKHDYLRISLLERCNLRCQYCMPAEGIPLRDKAEFMSQEELFEIVDVFVGFGIKKIRLTGGEPLIKKNFDAIARHLGNQVPELTITTNGILLDRYWETLKASRIQSLNISIDTLKRDKFEHITRRNYFDRVMRNIHTAIEQGFQVKLNAVLMRGENEDEILDFITLTKELPVAVRFIEFMPFDGNEWNWEKKVSFREIIDRVRSVYGEALLPLGIEANGTSRNFKIEGFQGSFGIISSVTNPFCDSCNRIRLTADGKIKNCLFSGDESDLLSALRAGKDIEKLIITSIQQKHKARAGLKDFDDQDFESENRSMIRIGG